MNSIDRPSIPLKPEWRPILELRSVKDKIGIEVDCDVAEPGVMNVVTELVHEGLMVWIDRTVLPFVVRDKKQSKIARIGVNADVYQLTLKGIRLCNEHGIKQR